MHTQYYLPIIARETKKVLGLYNLGENVDFDGTEIAYTLAAGEIAIEEWVPTPSLIRPVNTAFMASVWDHADVFNRAYRGFAEFVPLEDVLPTHSISSASGLANYVREYRGPLITGLSETFGVGLANLVPINTAAPYITGTPTTGNVLTSTNGGWSNSPTSFNHQWFRDDVAIPGETEDTYTLVIGDVGLDINCVVVAVNARGTSRSVYTSNTITPAS